MAAAGLSCSLDLQEEGEGKSLLWPCDSSHPSLGFPPAQWGPSCILGRVALGTTVHEVPGPQQTLQNSRHFISPLSLPPEHPTSPSDTTGDILGSLPEGEARMEVVCLAQKAVLREPAP